MILSSLFNSINEIVPIRIIIKVITIMKIDNDTNILPLIISLTYTLLVFDPNIFNNNPHMPSNNIKYIIIGILIV